MGVLSWAWHMVVARILVAGSLVFFVAAGLPGCVSGNEACTPGDAQCVGSSGAYRICSGGEGYYSWDNHQCPGVQPVCSSPQSGTTSCGDAAAPAQCPRVSPLLDAGTATLSNVVDLERDGTADLVFGKDLVARSDGHGVFEQPHSLGLLTAGSLLGLLPAELNGDGVADLAVMSDDPRELYAFFGNADASYTFAQRYFVSSLPGLDIAVDFDGDGRDELVGGASYEGVHVISGLGDAALTDRLIDTTDPLTGSSILRGVFVADFDGQAPLDLAANGSSLDIYLTQADGSHLRTASIWRGDAVGDLDGDGRADVAGATSDSDHPGLSIHFAGSDATFQGSLTLPVPYAPSSVFIADFDGDKVNDVAALLARSPQALLQVFLGNGDGSFHATNLVSVRFDANTRVFATDVENDGKTDLVGQVDGEVLELSGACVAP